MGPLPSLPVVICLLLALPLLNLGDGKDLPLKVSAIVPTDKGIYKLENQQDVVVVFNRPVIALGSDFNNKLTQAPFSLVCKNMENKDCVNGTLRWVTTSTARFTPRGKWQTDLRLVLTINPKLVTYDGVTLSPDLGSQTQEYTTQGLVVDIKRVESPLATQLTDGEWSSVISSSMFKEFAHEVPPDGVIHAWVDTPVDVATLQKGMVMTPSCPENLKSLTNCGSAKENIKVTISEYTPEVISLRKGKANLGQYLEIKPRTPLMSAERYLLFVPAGTRYSPNSGPTSEAISQAVYGLLPNKVHLEKPWRAQYTRYRIGFRHGLPQNITHKQLLSVIQIAPQLNPGTKVYNLSKSAVIIEGNFLPSTNYKVTVKASPLVVDGFGQSLQRSSIAFTTESFMPVTAHPTDYIAYFEADFANKTSAPQGVNWGAVIMNPQPITCYQDGSTREFTPKMTAHSVTSANLEDNLNDLVRDRSEGYDDTNDLRVKADQEVLLTNLPGSDEEDLRLDSKMLNTSQLLQPSGLVLVRYWRTAWSTGKNEKCRYMPTSQWLSSSDISPVVMVTEDDNTVTVWVTRISNGSPIEGAKVHVFILNEDSGAPGSNSAAKAATVTTNKNGVAITTIRQQLMSGSRLAVFVADKTHLVMAADPHTFRLRHHRAAPERLAYYRPSPLSSRGHRSHQRYSPSPLSYLQSHTKGIASVPVGKTFRIGIRFSRTHIVYKYVQFDQLYGSFNSSFLVPLNATLSSHRLVLECTNYQEPGKPTPSSNVIVPLGSTTDILVADPREPSATLTMTHDQDFLMPGSPLDIIVHTMTYTESPIANAKVTLRWKLNLYGVPSKAFEDDEDLLKDTEGEITVTTDNTGKAVGRLSIRHANMTVGDMLDVTADWLGPTGELLSQTQRFPVAFSRWNMQVVPTSSDPLPGTRMAFFIEVTESDGTLLKDVPVSVAIYQHDASSRSLYLPQPPSGAIIPEGPSLDTTQCVAQGLAFMTCLITLPNKVGAFVVVISVTDNKGKILSKAINVGKTAEAWKKRPLNSFDDIAIVADKGNYTVGDKARFNWYNPFPTAKAFALWGNKQTQYHRIVDVPHGLASIDIPIGKIECTGGCTVSVAISAPRRPNDSVKLPDGVAISPLLDLSAPFTLLKDLSLHIVDPSRVLSVHVNPEQTVVAPGKQTTLKVAVKDGEGQPAGSASVCVVVVNQAFLDLSPYPLQQSGNDLAVDARAIIASKSLATNGLPGYTGFSRAHSIIIRRLKRDGYLTNINWNILPKSNPWFVDPLDLSDEVYFKNIYTDLTATEYLNDGLLNDAVEQVRRPSWSANAPPGPPMAANTVANDEINAENKLLGPQGDDGSTAVTLTNPNLVRSNFVVTPLFISDVRTNANGEADIALRLPDNVGAFVVRAYAVSKDLLYASGESAITARQPESIISFRLPLFISMRFVLPRIARLGDVFYGGVTATMTDPLFRGTVRVTVKVEGPIVLCEGTKDTVEVSVERTGPVPAVFKLCTNGEGNATFQFHSEVQVGDVLASDSVQANIMAYGWMDPVSVATSMAIDAANANPWKEGVVMPPSVPNSGSMMILVGVGHRPSVEAMVDGINVCCDRASSGADIASILAGPASLSKYHHKKGEAEGETLLKSKEKEKEALLLLADYTVPVLGLLWDLPKTSRDNAIFSDPWLNAFALHVAGRAKVTTGLEGTWREALHGQMVTKADEATSLNIGFHDWTLLAWCYLALGLDYDFKVPGISLAHLRYNLNSTSYEGQAALGLAYTLAGKAHHRVANDIASRLSNHVRVQGRTAYFTGANTIVPSYTTNALALSFLALRTNKNSAVDTPLLSKIAEYVAQGRLEQSGEQRSWFYRGISNPQRALGVMALADYDQSVGSTNPNMTLDVVSKDTVLLSATFKTSSNLPALHDRSFTFGGAAAPDIKFFAQGSGMSSVVVSLQFVPAVIPTKPVERGFTVNKIIQILDAVTNKVKGSPITSKDMVPPGTYVQITLEITTPDMVDNVWVNDGVPGGLEALDSAIYSNVPSDTSGRSSIFPFWWFSPFQHKEVKADRVVYYARRLWPGVHTLTYTAMSVTPGAYTIPPTLVHCAAAPEIMGLSIGGWLVTEQSFLAIEPEKRRALTTTQPITPIGSQRTLDVVLPMEHNELAKEHNQIVAAPSPSPSALATPSVIKDQVGTKSTHWYHAITSVILALATIAISGALFAFLRGRQQER
eukprot:Ihof_evm10s7 gene=Ihof_evmTU10s7